MRRIRFSCLTLFLLSCFLHVPCCQKNLEYYLQRWNYFCCSKPEAEIRCFYLLKLGFVGKLQGPIVACLLGYSKLHALYHCYCLFLHFTRPGKLLPLLDRSAALLVYLSFSGHCRLLCL